ncbi:MAG: hypothetical protein AB1544_04335 [Pseudomonadota bacterium]|jgi:hypothetical protein
METRSVTLNGRAVRVALSSAARQALAQRTEPLYVELELYFSCLVKKFVHFRDDSRGKPTVPVDDKLLLYFRPVTSTACTWDVAERLGRQPEMDIDSAALHHVAPKRVFIDHVDGQWRGSYEFL